MSKTLKFKVRAQLCAGLPGNVGIVLIDEEDAYHLRSEFWIITKDTNCLYVKLPSNSYSSGGKDKYKVLSREILGIDDKKICVYHINGNNLDLRKINLAIETAQQHGKRVLK